MISRAIERICFATLFGRQMRLIAGPRQVGKTTLAKNFLKQKGCDKLYYNWDSRKTRNRFKTEPYFYNSDAIELGTTKRKWICFDEIHKFPRWKDILKDAFDSFEDKYRFIVTGSARLDFFRKSGDSLSGRYFLFRMLPVSLFEMLGQTLPPPAKNAQEYIEKNIGKNSHQSDMEQLIHFSGFPEPLTRGNKVFSSKWHDEYIDTLLREDLRDITRIHELENVITMMHLLPERVGAPLSINSLKGDMEVSYNALRNYIRALTLTYVIFSIPPYSKKLNRAIKKEKKVYFFDWSQISDEAKRFENYIACELNHRVNLWTMTTEHRFDLHYVRMRDGKESDFLITQDDKPYLLIEAKLSSENIESHNLRHASLLGNIPFLQLVQKPDILKAGKHSDYVISASKFL